MSSCYKISKFNREGNTSFDPFERCSTPFFKKYCCETCKSKTRNLFFFIELNIYL